MKILFCIGSLEKGGAERVISNLANYFIDNNDVGIVLTLRKVEYSLDNRIKLYDLMYDGKLRRLKKLYDIIKEYNPDIIVSFLPEPSYRLLMLKNFIKVPIIVSVRNNPYTEYSSFRRRILMKVLYPLADGFVFQTADAKKYFNKKIQNKSVIIPNPISDAFLKRDIYRGKRNNVIVSVGRLEKQKNHELLIDSFYKNRKKFKGYKLLIYGDGSLKEKLQKKIDLLNMKEQIFLVGKVDNIASEIEDAKLFVMSSDYEGMPNALMEAMALGLVCISTDCACGGPKYLIEDGKNGFLVDVNDINQMSKKMDFVINDISSKEYDGISKQAKETAMNFGENIINKKWESFLMSIKNNK